MEVATSVRKKFLFVCTGNTCRSPMAQGWFADQLKGLGLWPDVDMDSCGVSAQDGLGPSEEAVRVLRELEIDITSFRTKAISKEKVLWADRIITMAENHREYILLHYPEVDPSRIVVLNAPDPLGEGVDSYRKSFVIIKEGLRKEMKRLITVALGADHGGFQLKEVLRQALEKEGYSVRDCGTHSPASCDYPDVAFPVAEEVARDHFVRGILTCTSGGGMVLAANKVKGVRAVHCLTAEQASFARSHNNMNLLVLSGKYTKPQDAVEIAKAFLTTAFDGGRHERRIGKIKDYEEKHWKD